MYKSNNTPITNTIVEQYLFELPASKLFWRLFKNLENGVSLEQLTSKLSTITVGTVITNSTETEVAPLQNLTSINDSPMEIN